jgi:hypothetical protein
VLVRSPFDFAEGLAITYCTDFSDNFYSGLQFYASSVGAILVIAHASRAKTSFALTEKRSHDYEIRTKSCILLEFPRFC